MSRNDLVPSDSGSNNTLVNADLSKNQISQFEQKGGIFAFVGQTKQTIESVVDAESPQKMYKYQDNVGNMLAQFSLLAGSNNPNSDKNIEYFKKQMQALSEEGNAWQLQFVMAAYLKSSETVALPQLVDVFDITDSAVLICLISCMTRNRISYKALNRVIEEAALYGEIEETLENIRGDLGERFEMYFAIEFVRQVLKSGGGKDIDRESGENNYYQGWDKNPNSHDPYDLFYSFEERGANAGEIEEARDEIDGLSYQLDENSNDEEHSWSGDFTQTEKDYMSPDEPLLEILEKMKSYNEDIYREIVERIVASKKYGLSLPTFGSLREMLNQELTINPHRVNRRFKDLGAITEGIPDNFHGDPDVDTRGADDVDF